MNSPSFRGPGRSRDDWVDALAHAAELRHGAGAELVDELRTTEMETELGRLRRQGLDTVWRQAMHRGDRVTATAAFGVVTGAVDYVGGDYASVIRADRCFDLRLDRCLLRVHRSRDGGHSVRGGSVTFKARLAEYAATGEPVAAIVPAVSDEVRGVIRVVAGDHVVLEASDGDVVLPITLVDGIRRNQ